MSVRPGYPYTVDVIAGPYSWSIDKGDAPAFGPMAPLSIGWDFPDDGLWPTAPESIRLNLSLIAAAQADVAALDIGSVVHVQVFLGVDNGAPTFDPLPSVVFSGRVAAMAGSPRRVNGTDAWQLDLTCIDYLADLGEREVSGFMPFQGVGVQVWIERFFALAGLPAPDWNGGGPGSAQLTLNDGQVEPGSLAAVADKMLSSYADGGDWIGSESVPANHDWYPYEGWRRGYLQPDVDPDTGELEGWRLAWFSRRNTVSSYSSACSYPAELQNLGIHAEDPLRPWEVVMVPSPSGVLDVTQVVEADYVDFGATWRRSKNTTPTAIIVSNLTPEAEAPGVWRQTQLTTTEPRAQVATRITDSLAYLEFNAQFACEMLLPDPAPYKDTADAFHYYASADPSWPMIPSWFPGQHQLWFGHSIPLIITGLPPTQSPVDERGFYAGTLGGCTFTIEPGGVFGFDFTMHPGAPRPGGFPSAFEWNYLAVQTVAITCTPAKIDRRVTVHDIRLCRNVTPSP